ncbi:DUF2975 domain-containing protein [Maribacter aurantiacus]|uniref:DUF2975 domain-containing protein n=1 Tax=Maribacter aurantiacus TaxID=1882343 RepID=A0A5R8M468_9FLAO|nr:DUF2975 domain-containing protein [Maribacter aurantiacus]TLF44335.1 DUF2975 domain-containing protein [Maribacter aurantiacus]
MKTRVKAKNLIFKGLKIISWIIFVGLSVEAGGLIVNFIFSLLRPEFIQNLYQKLDMSQLFQSSKLAFFGMYGFVLTVSILKAVLFYQVVLLVTKIDLPKPFNRWVSKQIIKISYYTLSIGLLSFIARKLAMDLGHNGFTLNQLDPFWADSQAFILMAAVIYIIGTIFSKGVEYQEELEETV